jgi:opacity protein-like surface antigen
MAVGRASYSVTTEAFGQQSTANPPFPNADGTCTPSATCVNYDFTNATGQNNALLWGYTVGAGLDWALTPNIFVRGEFEFVQFARSPTFRSRWRAAASAPASNSKIQTLWPSRLDPHRPSSISEKIRRRDTVGA